MTITRIELTREEMKEAVHQWLCTKGIHLEWGIDSITDRYVSWSVEPSKKPLPPTPEPPTANDQTNNQA
jgi:hypothetical protein